MADVDRSTIEALRRGEDQAYEAVIDLLGGPVYRFVLHLCSDSSTAEDITQETFLAMWQGIGSFKGRSKFKTWVFGIAYHQFLRHRDKSAVQTVPLDGNQDEGVSSNPCTIVEKTDEKYRIQRAIYSLPEPYRETVCFVHLDGLSYREAAETLGVPVGTVKSRMSGAFRLLREKLKESEVEHCEVREPEGIPRRGTSPR